MARFIGILLLILSSSVFADTLNCISYLPVQGTFLELTNTNIGRFLKDDNQTLLLFSFTDCSVAMNYKSKDDTAAEHKVLHDDGQE